MIRLLRGLVAAAALFSIHSSAQAFDYTQVPWGIRLGVSPAPLCVTTGGDACKYQIGTINAATNSFFPAGFVSATSYSTVQAAMTAAAAVNAALWMPCGTYTGAPATVPVGLTIIGEAPGCVGVSTSAATGDIWTLGGFNYIRNVGFSYSGAGQRTSGAYIKVSSGAAAADIGDVFFRDGCEDTHWLGGGVSYLRNSVTERGGNGCRSHVVEGNIALHIISMTTGAASTSQTAALNVINAEVNCIDCLLQGALDDVLINPPSGKVAFFHAVNSYFDDAVTHAVNIIPNDGVVQRVALTNTWMVSRAGGGNAFNAAPTGVGSVNGITISQAHLPGFAAGTTSDIYLGAGVSNIELSDVHVSGGQNGINCDGCEKLNIGNSNVGPVEGFAAVTFGIAIQGAAKYINIGNSKVVGNVTGVTISGTADYITLSGVTSDNNSTINFFCGTSGTHVQAIGNIGIPDFYGACGATPPYASVSAANTWALTQTFTVAPIFTSLTGYLKGNGASAITAAATVPLSDLAAQATNTIVGNATAGSAAPTALAIGSCDTATKAVQWTTNTGFGCNTSINAATLGGATFAAPGAIGSGSPGTGAFTTVSATGQFTSTLATGTAPFSIASTTVVPNLYVARAQSADAVASTGFANPTASVGLAAVNGTATTAMRSDGAPALSQAIVPTWSGIHTFSAAPIFTLGAKYSGSSSGTVSVVASATAGTPTITWGNASGTPAVTASAPLALSTTTGNMTVTGAAGQVLAGSTPAFTATPTLGVAGSTVGALALANATSGTVTLQPVTGALGSAVLSLPATTSTVAVTGNNLSAFASTTSAQLAGVISDETGSGALVFGTSPTLTTAVLGSSTATTQAANDNSTKLATTGYMDSDAVAWGTAPVAGCLSGGSITTSSTTGFVKQFGKLVWIEVKLVVTANTCGGAVTSTIPSGTTASTANTLVGHSSATGDMLQVGPTSAGGTTLNINSYNNGVPGVTTITFSGLLRLS